MTLQIVTERQADGEYRYRCARSKDGRGPVAIGCRHLSPRSADEHTRQLAAVAGISPLRAAPSSAPDASAAIAVVQGQNGASHEDAGLRPTAPGGAPLPLGPSGL
jgi:hypothetical protein